MAKKKKAAPDADGEEEKGGKDPKMMAIGGLVVAGLVYQFVLKSPPPEEPLGADGVAVTTTVPMVAGEIFELPEMVLNIDDPDITYLRIQFAVVLDELTLAKDFEKESAIAKDIIVDKLGSYSAAQLNDPAAREVLKEELSTEIRTAYGESKVVQVLITSLVMQ